MSYLQFRFKFSAHKQVATAMNNIILWENDQFSITKSNKITINYIKYLIIYWIAICNFKDAR